VGLQEDQELFYGYMADTIRERQREQYREHLPDLQAQKVLDGLGIAVVIAGIVIVLGIFIYTAWLGSGSSNRGPIVRDAVTGELR
jgi:uncharacterized membrane protein YkgB